MATRTLGELAAEVGGTVHGDESVQIHSVATLEDAAAGQITFLANRRYARLLHTTRATAVVVGAPVAVPVAQLVAEDPYYAFAQIVVLIHGHREHPFSGISAQAAIDPSAVIGEETRIHDRVTVSAGVRIGRRGVVYPGVFIGPEVEIGDDCLIYPNVVIYDRCHIGHRVILQANATIGEDGFGFATHQGVHHKIPHLGRVILEDDVEIGSNCAIERGTLQDTVIGRGSKLGDLVAIGHGTAVGPGCLLVAQVGVAGSTSLGHHCIVGGQAGIVGHLRIGDLARIAAQSGVTKNVPDGGRVLGSPAVEAATAKQAYALLKSLPELRRRLIHVEATLKRLEKQS